MCHPHNGQSDPFVKKAKALLAKDGIAVERVTYGGTSEMGLAHTRKQVTEYRAGVYIYGDRFVLRAGAMKPEDCSLKIITTLVSRPTPDRGIMDGGSKAFTSDLLGFKDYGSILEYPEAVFFNFSEEHGWVDFSKCPQKPKIGERLTVIPNHCCVISNLFNEMVGFRKDKVEVTWKVAARGASQ
jgi:D-serine deaminase-like pyridoxal phosphate-dependent protein